MVIRLLKFCRTKYLLYKQRKKCNFIGQVIIDKNVYLEGKNRIADKTKVINSKIGFASYLGERCFICNTNIGRYCCVANDVRIINGTHPTNTYVSVHPAFYSTGKQSGFSFVEEDKFKENKYLCEKNKISVIIGNDVWIGEGVRILEGIRIGDGAIVAAGAVVTHDVDNYDIVGGVPAKKIKQRFEKCEIDFLRRFKWWDKDYEWLRKHANDFCDIKTFIFLNEKNGEENDE